MSLWWLSFADPDKPAGEQFLGVAIEPGMRISLLKRGLIVALDPPRPPHEHRRTRPPKRRHPLTAAGREAIGVSGSAEVAANVVA